MERKKKHTPLTPKGSADFDLGPPPTGGPGGGFGLSVPKGDQEFLADFGPDRWNFVFFDFMLALSAPGVKTRPESPNKPSALLVVTTR